MLLSFRRENEPRGDGSRHASPTDVAVRGRHFVRVDAADGRSVRGACRPPRAARDFSARPVRTGGGVKTNVLFYLFIIFFNVFSFEIFKFFPIGKSVVRHAGRFTGRHARANTHALAQTNKHTHTPRAHTQCRFGANCRPTCRQRVPPAGASVAPPRRTGAAAQDAHIPRARPRAPRGDTRGPRTKYII